jgi:hypothetical protein
MQKEAPMKDDTGTTTAWDFRRLFSGFAAVCLLGAGLMDVYHLATDGSFAFSWKGGDMAIYAWPGDWIAIAIFLVVEFIGGALCLRDFLRPARSRP